MNDTKYLKLRHNTWYFQKGVTKALAPHCRQKKLIEISLKTGDIREARIKRDIILGNLRDQEHSLEAMPVERRQFKAYVEEMLFAKENDLMEEVEDPKTGRPVLVGTWEDAYYPPDNDKADDPAYCAAYRAVTAGKTESPGYHITIPELLQTFTGDSKRNKKHTPGTLDRYKDSVRRFCTFYGQPYPAAINIQKKDVREFISNLQGRHENSTVYGHISRLKTLYKFSINHELIDCQNPFEGHSVPAQTKQHKQPFNPDEFRKLLEVMSGQLAPMKLLVLLGICTGARISELVALPLSKIEVVDGVTLAGLAMEATGKTEAATRRVPIPPRCHSLLEQVMSEAKEARSDYLFYNLISAREDKRPAYKATKLFGAIKQKHITNEKSKGFHSFRVMMATALQRALVPETLAAEILGHSRKGLTLSYSLYAKGFAPVQLAEAQDKALEVLDRDYGETIKIAQ